jgi:hypothetical protein
MVRRHNVREHGRITGARVREHVRGTVDPRDLNTMAIERHNREIRLAHPLEENEAMAFAAWVDSYDATEDERLAGGLDLEDAADMYMVIDNRDATIKSYYRVLPDLKDPAIYRLTIDKIDELTEMNRQDRTQADAIQRHRARKYGEVFE